MSARAWLVAVLVVAVASSVGAQRDTTAGFPHERHAKLFPTCLGCHVGIASGDSAAMFPSPAQCARCHDGTLESKVSWTGPTPMPTNLEFSHVAHERESIAHGDTLACRACHTPADRRDTWMAVTAARPRVCFQCHAHGPTEHFAAGNVCTTCHVPLVQARALSDSAIAAFPHPPSHERPDFLTSHAPRDASAEAQCATCHARESCERCHVNAGLLGAVTRLERDPRVARLAASRPAVYPVPASHRSASWAYDHAGAAHRQTASCANCHAQPSCTACHIGSGARSTIAKLPRAEPGKAQGVVIRHVGPSSPGEPQASAAPRPPSIASAWPAPTAAAGSGGAELAADTGAVVERDSGRVHYVRVHWPDFVRTHGTLASSGQMRCASCHEQRFCTNCHEGETRRNFHPANFIARHAVEAYGRESDCARCHNTEAFCRSCHVGSGQATRNPRHAAFHTGQPLWLLQHGQAARQSLESCASCHQQRDCLRCHSALGGNINPHGPSFDPKRMASRNKIVCRVCHLGDPLASTP